MFTNRRLLVPALLVSFGSAWSSRAASFDVTGTTTSAQTLNAGETGKVQTGGTLSVSGSNVAVTVAGNSTITNSGTIRQTGTGRTIDANTNNVSLTVTNNAGALIQSADADTFRVNKANVAVTLNNSGSIISLNPSAGGSQAIDWTAITTGANTLNNLAGGIIRATAADAVRPGVNGVINNAGTIEAIPVVEGSSPNRAPSGSDGIDAQTNTGVQLTNSGLVSGRHGITGGADNITFDITVKNEVGGVIQGVNGSGVNIDGNLSHATVTNSGTIAGYFDATKYDIGDGDGVDVDGTVTLTNNGIIRGIGAGGGDNNSEGVSIGGGTVINNAGAEISGRNDTGTSAAGNGLLVDNSSGGAAYAATTITNSGTIRGYSGFAIRMIGDLNDSVTNTAGGVIQGAGTGAAIQTGGGNDTVVNRGSIIGDNGRAIDLEDGDDTLRIEGGAASVTGSISGGAGTNSMVVAPGAGQSFQYAGTISNFATVEVQSGTVTLSGQSTYTGVTRLTGGTLVLSGADRLSSASSLELAGGTLELRDIGTLTGQTFASLSLTDDSTIDLNDLTTLTFGAFGGRTDGATLAILGYDAALADYAIRFAGDLTQDAAFLAFIGATTVDGQAATASYVNGYTTVSVPEPAAAGMLLLGGFGLFAGRRLLRWRRF